MKIITTLILLLVASLAPAQQLIRVTPYVGATEVDSVILRNGFATAEITNAAVGLFPAAAVAGVRVQGVGLPYGTTISSRSGDTLLTLSNTVTTSDSLSILQFAVEGDTIYAANMAMGFTFKISAEKIHSISVMDKSKQITSVNLAFFSEYKPVRENQTFAPSDANAAFIYNLIPVDSNTVFTNNHIMTRGELALPIVMPSSDVFIQMIATGADTVNAIDDVTVNFVVE